MSEHITGLLSNVDRYGQRFVQQAYENLSSALTEDGQIGVAGLMLTLYVIFWAFGIWQGTAQGSPVEITFRLLRAFAIYTLATNWDDFETYIYTVLNDGPSAIGNAILKSISYNVTGTSAALNSTSGVQHALQNLWDSIATTTSTYIKSLGVLNYGGYFLALAVLLVGALLIGYAVFLIILSKIFLWLLLALAPVFIILMLFGFTSRFFSGWATSIAQYVCVQVLVYAFCAFFLSVSQTYFDRIVQANDNGWTTLTEVAPLILICVIGILLLMQIVNVAASIAGGVAIAAPSIGALMRKAAAVSGVGLAAQIVGQKAVDRTGLILPGEQAQGRARARQLVAQQRYEQTAAHRRLARKLTETA